MKIQQLDEALRFGGREINALRKMSRDIMVSFEYEFNVTRRIGDEAPEEEEEPQSFEDMMEFGEVFDHPQYQEMESAEMDEMILDFENEVNRKFTPDSVLQVATDFEQKIRQQVNGGPNIGEAIDLLGELDERWENDESILGTNEGRQALQSVWQLLESVTRTDVFTDLDIEGENAQSVEDSFSVDVPGLFLNLRNDHQVLWDGLFNTLNETAWTKYSNSENYNSEQSEFDFMIEDFEEELEEFMETFVEEIEELTESLELVTTVIEEYPDANEEYEDSVNETAAENASQNIDSSYILDQFREWYENQSQTGTLWSVSQKIDYIESLIAEGEFGVRTDLLEVVEPDVSVPNGVEVTFYAMPLEEALDNMDKMFKLIDAVGNTAENTGLHCNISFKNERFNRREFSPSRLFLLMDERFIRQQFAVRGHVSNMVNDSYTNINNAVSRYVRRGYDGLREQTDEIINTGEKFQTVNFRHLQRDWYKQGRVEFRAPGGTDYHKRGQEIRQFTYRMAYLTKAAFDPNFDEKHYNEALFRFWNRMALKVNAKYGHKNVGFVEMIAFYRNKGVFLNQAIPSNAVKPKDFINKMGI